MRRVIYQPDRDESIVPPATPIIKGLVRPFLAVDLLLSFIADRGMGFSSSKESNFQKPSEGNEDMEDNRLFYSSFFFLTE